MKLYFQLLNPDGIFLQTFMFYYIYQITKNNTRQNQFIMELKKTFP